MVASRSRLTADILRALAAGSSVTDPLALHAANNLSDVPNKALARLNLGLGSVATHDFNEFALAGTVGGGGGDGGTDITNINSENVYYQGGGSGAIIRTLRERIRDLAVNIKDYGAVEGSDISGALLAAYNYLDRGAADFGGTIKIPRGIWKLSPTTILPKHAGEARIMIEGDPSGTTIIPADGSTAGASLLTLATGHMGIRYINWANPANLNTNAIRLLGSSTTADIESFIYIGHCQFKGFRTHIRNDYIAYWLVDYCQFYAVANSDIHIFASAGGEHMRIHNCDMFGGRGLVCGTPASTEGPCHRHRHCHKVKMWECWKCLECHHGEHFHFDECDFHCIPDNPDACCHFRGRCHRVHFKHCKCHGPHPRKWWITEYCEEIHFHGCHAECDDDDQGHGWHCDGPGVRRIHFHGCHGHGHNTDCHFGVCTEVFGHGCDFQSTNSINELNDTTTCCWVGCNFRKVLRKSIRTAHVFCCPDTLDINGRQRILCENSVNDICLDIRCHALNQTAPVHSIVCDRPAGSDFDFMQCVSSGRQGDKKFRFRGSGQADSAGSWRSGGADYAEWFEWGDGNPDNQDRVGHSVTLRDGKIWLANDGDDVLGVISATPGVVGDNAEDQWAGKYLYDDFGRPLLEEYEIVTWTEGGTEYTFAMESIPPGAVPPPDAVRRTEKRPKLNPDWNPNTPYIPRSQRPEWTVVGLLGKLRMLKGQTVGEDWIKMADISGSVELWFVR